ncbi:alpha-glucosidase [Lacticaseibacillus zhaodongensis]|uniref:alpha-glucosidase n=1 Tax=Lacticaseibacillus zhaodongensis TaxID=2668065 RepID=UPI0012D2D66D|nr:alpha-glucosidase [Lacticaseibacillus zhaodongensis]
MNNQWWRQAVIYQVYPKSFQDTNGDGIGDLQGIIEHLPYIKRLGADAVWLSPVYCSPQVDNGYDIADYRHVDPMFGSDADMDELIKQAHHLGLKIIMDLVANHTSDQHAWFKQSRQSKDNPYSDYYIWRDPAPDGGVPNNWGSSFGGSAWTFDDTRGQYYLHYYSPQQPDLNWENPKVRQAVYDIMRYWVVKGVDGWRLDVITSISKDQQFCDRPNPKHLPYVSSGQNNGPRMHEFIAEMNREVFTPLNQLSIGEAPDSSSENVLALVAPDQHELNMVIPFEHMKSDVVPGGNGHFDLQPLDVVYLKGVLSRWQETLASVNAGSALYFENHDRARIPSRWGDDGKYRYQSATAFATALHGLRGTPFVYQGEEIGLTNTKLKLEDYEDVETKGAYHKLVEEQKVMTKSQFVEAANKVSRDHARMPIPWNGGEQGGFTTGKPWFALNPSFPQINVRNDLESKQSVFEYYQRLIKLRHELGVLTDGAYELIAPEDPHVFGYWRIDTNQRLLVIANLSAHEQSITPYSQAAEETCKIIITNYADRRSLKEPLRPYEAMIVGVANRSSSRNS